MTLQYNTTKGFIILLLFMLSTTISVAQHRHGSNKESRERIDAAKIGHITMRLNLTTDQAEKFWPIFNEFTNKKRAFKDDFKTQFEGKQKSEFTDEDKRKIIDFEIEIKEKELELTKEYKNRFMEVLTLDQMLELKKAEDEFRRMLLNKMKHKEKGERKEERHDNKHQNRKKP